MFAAAGNWSTGKKHVLCRMGWQGLSLLLLGLADSLGSLEAARYYLIAKGTPGSMPEKVWDTWWHADEEGQGSEVYLYERAMTRKRFDHIVFYYMMTGDLNNRLLETMQGRYEPVATFPAFTNWDDRIDVFRMID